MRQAWNMRGRIPHQMPFLSLAAACCAALLILAGCTQPPPLTPTTAPSTSPSRTSSSATSTTASPSTNSEDQLAIQGVERFYQELNKALTTLSTKDFRSTFKPGCEACDFAANKIDSAAAAGRKFVGGRVSVTELRVVSRSTNARVLSLQGVVTSEPIAVRDARGQVVESDPGDSGPKFFVVFKAESGWLISGVGNA